MHLDLQSERYSPTGSLASTGVLNQLGRPNLDILTVLVREAVQNSWDAKLPGLEPARFGIAGYTLTQQQRDTLRNTVLDILPPDFDREHLLSSSSPLNVLTLYDRGTTGLGGPTRADIPGEPSEGHDFVDFLRNVGQPPDKKLGGGTYGYGKAALYLASQLRTICVHTHCLASGKPEQRFMAAALSAPYTVEEPDDPRGGGRYTGRHWWGRYDDEEIAGPLRGDEADRLALDLGMPPFLQGERGTTILILAPFLGDGTPVQALNSMAEALLWYFWPKMLDTENHVPTMSFELSWNGNTIPLLHPSDFPPLQGFLQAMELLKRGEVPAASDSMNRLISIDSVRPKRHLGRLALSKFPVLSRRQLDTGSESSMSPVRDLCHHIALMRPAELVVKYLEVTPLPSDLVEYAGVFIADAGVDRVFAKAEPPTHDDWVYRFLDNSDERTYIRVALRNIDGAARDFAEPTPGAVSVSSAITPLGAFADELGRLLPGQDGPGAFVQPVRDRSSDPHQDVAVRPITTGNTAPAGHNGVGQGGEAERHQLPKVRTAVRVLGSHLQYIGDVPALITSFTLESSGRPAFSKASVQARAGVVLDGGEFEAEPPAGGHVPRILFWVDAAGVRHKPSSVIEIPSGESGTWQIAVSVPDGCMVGLDLTAREIAT